MPPMIAILGLEVVGTVDLEVVRVARELTAALRSAATSGPYAVAPNSDKELVDVKILNSCPDERAACMIKIARALNAAYLLYGHVERRAQGAVRGYQTSLWLLRASDGQLASSTDFIPAAEASGSRLAERGRRDYERLVTSPVADRTVTDRSVADRSVADRALIDATNRVFWEITKHKPGQRLDMSDPRDRAMSKTWMDIYGQVRGHRDRAVQLARRTHKETGSTYVLVIENRDGSLIHQEFPDRNHLDVMYTWLRDEPEDYTYLAMFDFKQHDFLQEDQFALSKRQQAAASGW